MFYDECTTKKTERKKLILGTIQIWYAFQCQLKHYTMNGQKYYTKIFFLKILKIFKIKIFFLEY